MPKNSRAFDSVYLAIGRIVANWCIVEYELDRCIATIHKRCKGRIVADDIPIALNKKIKLLKRSFKDDPRLAPLAADGRKLLSRISALKEHRHLATHGAISGLNIKTTVVSFSKFQVTGKSATVKRSGIALSLLNEKADEIIDLCFAVGFFVAQFEQALSSSK